MPFYSVKLNNKYGLIEIETKKFILPQKFDEIYPVLADDLLFVVGQNGKFSAKDTDGKTVFRFNQNNAEEIVSKIGDGDFLFNVLDEEFNGKLNKLEGQPQKYESDWVGDDIFIIKSNENHKYGLEINKEIVKTTEFDTIYQLKEQNIFTLIKNGKFSCVNFKGIELLKPQPLEVISYTSQYFRVKDEGGFSLIDKNGTKVTSKIYNEIDNFSESFAKCKLNGKYGYIQERNNKIIEPEHLDYIAASNYNEGFSSVAFSKDKYYENIWIMINAKGEQVLDIEFVHHEPPKFINGMTPFKKGNYWGMINKFGDITINSKYQRIYQFGSKELWVKRFNVEYKIDLSENFIGWNN